MYIYNTVIQSNLMINMYVKDKVEGSRFYIDIPEYSYYPKYITVIAKNGC